MSTLNQNIHQAIEDFDNIKSAIIEKGVDVPTGTSTSDYGEKIKEIETGITPTGTIDITENGLHNVAAYEFANVDVPQPSGKINITENGTDIDVAEYAVADVNVPQPSGTINIQMNGAVDVANFALADVDVSVDSLIETNFESTYSSDYNCYAIQYATTELKNEDKEYIVFLPSRTPEYNDIEVVGDYAFEHNDLITRVQCETPANYRHVGSYAFNNCKNLKYVEIPKMRSMSEYAFYLTPALNYVNSMYMSSVVIPRYAFQYSGIKEIICRSIEEEGFSSCTQLKVVGVKGDRLDNLATVDSNAFNRCHSLETLIFGESVIGGTRAVKLLANSLNINDGGEVFTLENFVISPTTTLIDENGVFGNTTMTINNVYFGGTESDYNTWVSSLNDSSLVTALNGATKHYNYNGNSRPFFDPNGIYGE